MNTNRTFASIVFVALIMNACNIKPPPTPTAIVPVTGSIGTISAEETLVESGPGEQLIQVTEIKDFYNNSTVRVTNGGVAKLDLLDNQISIRLFNDTAVGDVSADPAETLDPVVRMKLVFGGLTGEVTKNGIPAKFELANGVTIYILGTQFLVLYDPESGTTYIGNFDGTIAYTTPAQPSAQFTQAGQLYEISSTFQVQNLTLTFTRADIEDLTISKRSRLLDILKYYLQPIATSVPTLTLTPSLTPSPTLTLAPTRSTPCDKAVFVADVTIPDGTSFSPGFQFTKVWRLRNAGTCTWTNGYSLVFYRGEQMAGQSVNLPSTVAPGQTVDVSVGLVAPGVPGSYRGDWMLRNQSGALFGTGANGTTPIFVKISVAPNPITPGLPDLTVQITNMPPSFCDPATPTLCSYMTTIEFVITNNGNVDATGNFQVLIEDTGYPYGDLPSKTITVPNGLTAGASQTSSVTLVGLCYSCTAHVTVDSSNIIPESNEANNVSQKSS